MVFVRIFIRSAIKIAFMKDYYSILDTRFSDDIEIVRAAVSQDGGALEYASPQLRSNREVVFLAVKENGNAIQYADPCFGDDKELIITALSSVPDDDMGGNLWPGSTNIVLSCMSRRLREDPEVNGDGNNNYITFHDAGPLMQKFMNLLYWKEWKALKESREEDWQREYGVINKVRLEKWQRDVSQWKKTQRTDQYEGYKALREEIECMPKYETWRQQVFAKYGKKCEICSNVENLEIHHRRSFYLIMKHNNVRDKYQAFECMQLWDVDNGSVLCQVCHKHMESSQRHNKLS
jgi:hypothetical protein